MLCCPRSQLNQLPAALKDEMQEHLRLKFNHQEASDDQVRALEECGRGRVHVPQTPPPGQPAALQAASAAMARGG
jgi:hypothetical protein